MFENAGNHWQAPQAQTHETFLGLQTPELPVRTFPILDQHMCRGHHACLSSWEPRVQSLVEPILKVFK